MATSSVTLNNLKDDLLFLRIECDEQTQVFREHLEGLMKIFRMILTHPSEEKYKMIPLEKFKSKWPQKSMELLLRDSGWIIVDEQFVFTGNDADIKEVMNIFAEARVNIVPDVSEWISETKIERINFDQFDEVERRRREAKAIEREKELAQFMAEKAERIRVSEALRKEIRLDNEFKRKNKAAEIKQADEQKR